MNEFSDAEIVAFVDGEAEPALSEKIQQGLPQDPRLAARVQVMRETAAWLQTHFAASLDTPMPERLLRAVEQTRKVPPFQRRSAYWALAASVLFAAVLLSFLLPRLQVPTFEAQLAMAGFVQQALDSRLSGEVVVGSIDGVALELMPTASWHLPSGAVCREFAVDVLQGQSASRQGLACRTGPRWEVQVAALPAADVADIETYQPASHGKPLWDEPLKQARRLAPAEEAQWLQQGWSVAARE